MSTNAIKFGLSVGEVSKNYKIPTEVIQKWISKGWLHGGRGPGERFLINDLDKVKLLVQKMKTNPGRYA